mmetsp:Transcript_3843/g.11156  ORF Transcript_3843/g.11156 Transcript_3843/m.11156 type:complete len:296 (+) Transcript_3843:2102-2989(+)
MLCSAANRHSCASFAAFATTARNSDASAAFAFASASAFSSDWRNLHASPLTTLSLNLKMSASCCHFWHLCSEVSASSCNFRACACASVIAFSRRWASFCASCAASLDFRRSSCNSLPRGMPPKASASEVRSASNVFALTSTMLAFTFASTSTRIARDANSKVLMVSAAFSAAGLAQTSNEVLQLPPMQPSRILVSLESRRGTCAFFAANALTTFPSESKLLLMFVASLNCCPSAPLFLTRSEPAKSTIQSLDLTHSIFCAPAVDAVTLTARSRLVNRIWKTAWLRLDALFIFVSA